MDISKKLATALIGLALAGSMSAPAFAGIKPPEDPKKVKCNSGNGNNSESTPETDCDPGNSGGHNNGGD